MSFIDKMKKAGKSVVDAGAKTMLKVRPRQCVCVCVRPYWNGSRLLQVSITVTDCFDPILFLLLLASRSECLFASM